MSNLKDYDASNLVNTDDLLVEYSWGEGNEMRLNLFGSLCLNSWYIY